MELIKNIILLVLIALVSIRVYYLSSERQLDEYIGTKNIIVSKGDTVWGIANRECEGMNIHKAVYLIRELNKIDNPGALQPGQMLEIPIFEEQLATR